MWVLLIGNLSSGWPGATFAASEKKVSTLISDLSQLHHKNFSSVLKVIYGVMDSLFTAPYTFVVP